MALYCLRRTGHYFDYPEGKEMGKPPKKNIATVDRRTNYFPTLQLLAHLVRPLEVEESQNARIVPLHALYEAIRKSQPVLTLVDDQPVDIPCIGEFLELILRSVDARRSPFLRDEIEYVGRGVNPRRYRVIIVVADIVLPRVGSREHGGVTGYRLRGPRIDPGLGGVGALGAETIEVRYVVSEVSSFFDRRGPHAVYRDYNDVIGGQGGCGAGYRDGRSAWTH